MSPLVGRLRHPPHAARRAPRAARRTPHATRNTPHATRSSLVRHFVWAYVAQVLLCVDAYCAMAPAYTRQFSTGHRVALTCRALLASHGARVRALKDTTWDASSRVPLRRVLARIASLLLLTAPVDAAPYLAGFLEGHWSALAELVLTEPSQHEPQLRPDRLCSLDGATLLAYARSICVRALQLSQLLVDVSGVWVTSLASLRELACLVGLTATDCDLAPGAPSNGKATGCGA